MIQSYRLLAERCDYPLHLSVTEADLGVAAGKGKGQILRRGEVLYTVQEADIVETLVHVATELADELRTERGQGTPTVVTGAVRAPSRRSPVSRPGT